MATRTNDPTWFYTAATAAPWDAPDLLDVASDHVGPTRLSPKPKIAYPKDPLWSPCFYA